MFPTCVIGAVLALFIVTINCSFTNIQMYQYFIFHSVLIVYAVSIVVKGKVNITFKSILRTFIALLLLSVIMIWINSSLSDTYETENLKYYTNFFYLYAPPVKNLPVLNLNNGWYVYYLTLVGIALLLISLIDIPFAIKNKKKGIK